MSDEISEEFFDPLYCTTQVLTNSILPFLSRILNSHLILLIFVVTSIYTIIFIFADFHSYIVCCMTPIFSNSTSHFLNIRYNNPCRIVMISLHVHLFSHVLFLLWFKPYVPLLLPYAPVIYIINCSQF